MELKIPGMQLTQLNQWNIRVFKKTYKLDGWTGLNQHHLIFWTSNSNTNELHETLYFLLLKNPWMNNQLIKQVIPEPGPCLGQAPVWLLILQTARENGQSKIISSCLNKGSACFHTLTNNINHTNCTCSIHKSKNTTFAYCFFHQNV